MSQSNLDGFSFRKQLVRTLLCITTLYHWTKRPMELQKLIVSERGTSIRQLHVSLILIKTTNHKYYWKDKEDQNGKKAWGHRDATYRWERHCVQVRAHHGSNWPLQIRGYLWGIILDNTCSNRALGNVHYYLFWIHIFWLSLERMQTEINGVVAWIKLSNQIALAIDIGSGCHPQDTHRRCQTMDEDGLQEGCWARRTWVPQSATLENLIKQAISTHIKFMEKRLTRTHQLGTISTSGNRDLGSPL